MNIIELFGFYHISSGWKNCFSTKFTYLAGDCQRHHFEIYTFKVAVAILIFIIVAIIPQCFSTKQFQICGKIMISENTVMISSMVIISFTQIGPCD